MQLIKIHKAAINLFKLISVGLVIIIVYLYYKELGSTASSEPKLANTHSTQNSSPLEESRGKSQPSYEVSINNSIFKGINKDKQQYIVKADKAVKLSEHQYKLSNINADYPIKTNKLIIEAQYGLINDSTKIIELEDNVRLLLDLLVFNGEKIAINLRNKEIFSLDPIEVFYKNSKIKAQGFNTQNDNNIIHFKGNVTTRINPSDL